MEVDDNVLTQAEAKEKTNPQEAVKMYLEILSSAEKNGADTEDDLKIVEGAISKLGDLYAKLKNVKDLVKLAKDVRPLFPYFPKHKTAKIVRHVIDQVSRVQGCNPTEDLVQLCQSTIKWAEDESSAFLKSRVETRLASIYVDLKKYDAALNLLQGLVKEMKQLDDKLLLIEIHLIETKANFACDNLPKAKASLTAAKTNANQIHCPPLQQAEIDLWSGIVSLRENDPRTAFSYLFEAFEAFNANKDESSHHSNDYCESRALQSLRCQLLCRVMQDQPGGCKSLLQTKTALKYQTESSVQAIMKIANAYEDRSLKKLEEVLAKEPVNDVIIQYHLSDLYDAFVEKNLVKILEPFSQVEISHVAELIDLSIEKTVAKLSQMILDGKLLGTLDEGRGNLILYPKQEHRKTCDHIISTLSNASDCVDSLALLMKKIGTTSA